MSSQTITIENENDWSRVTAVLAPLLRQGDVLTLQGDLGAGKTAFSRVLIRTLDPDIGEVPSPTFTIIQMYDLPRFTLWHFDLYRLEEEERNILELGWDDAMRYGVTLVEWPERLSGLLPRNRLEINIRFVEQSDNKRSVLITPYGDWIERWREI